MARVRITMEDLGDRSVSFLTEIEGVEVADNNVTSAMALGLATRTLFENGLLSEAAAVSLAAVVEGKLPSATVLAHFNTRKRGGSDGSGA